MGNHLETLIAQFYEWKGWLVRRNTKVGPRPRGGFEGELDVVVYDPKSNEIIHFEPSLDADKWEKRSERYAKKFRLGRDHIFKDVFPWLKDPKPSLTQIAVFFNVGPDRKQFLDGIAMSIDEIVQKICGEIKKEGRVGNNAIPEQFDLLRTIQLVISGYSKKPT